MSRRFIDFMLQDPRVGLYWPLRPGFFRPDSGGAIDANGVYNARGTNLGSGSGSMTMATHVLADPAYPGSSGCTEFDGINDTVVGGAGAFPDAAADLTVGCWVKFSGSGTYHMLGQHQGTADAERWLLRPASGHLTWAKGNTTTTITDAAINTGAWRFVVVTRTTADNTVRCYIDSVVQAATASDALGFADPTLIDFQVGQGTGAAYWPGRISDVFACPAHALSAFEIRRLYDWARAPVERRNHPLAFARGLTRAAA